MSDVVSISYQADSIRYLARRARGVAEKIEANSIRSLIILGVCDDGLEFCDVLFPSGRANIGHLITMLDEVRLGLMDDFKEAAPSPVMEDGDGRDA